MCKLLSILNDLEKTKTLKEIADNLSISVSTIRRWKDLDNIPIIYELDLLRLQNKVIDYSKYDYKAKDQFFTDNKLAEYCINVVKTKLIELQEDIDEYDFIEPSAGDGSFYKQLPVDKRTGIDIENMVDGVIECDYLNWRPKKNGKYIIIGNPPFGLRGNLALKFINHSAKFGDYVCFILPQLFESDGKGVPRKRVKGLNLIHSEKIDNKYEFHEPDGKEIKINVIFQIWSKHHNNEKYDIKEIKKDILTVYSLSDGGTPSSTRNKNMLDKCDIYLPSTCFGKENMRYYNSFEELPNRKGYGIVFKKNKETNIKKFKETDWSEKAYLSTNSAYNIRTSQINAVFI